MPRNWKNAAAAKIPMTTIPMIDRTAAMSISLKILGSIKASAISLTATTMSIQPTMDMIGPTYGTGAIPTSVRMLPTPPRALACPRFAMRGARGDELVKISSRNGPLGRVDGNFGRKSVPFYLDERRLVEDSCWKVG